MPKPKSSPNILEWLLVVLMLLAIAGIGYLYLTIMQLNDSVVSTKADLLQVKSEMLAQQQVAEESSVIVEEEPSMEDWLTYAVADYRFQYPSTATIRPATDSFRVLNLTLVSGGEFELWKNDDFAERPIGFGGAVATEEEILAGLPKQEWFIRTSNADPSGGRLYNYTVRFYYSNDAERDELQRIANTIQ